MLKYIILFLCTALLTGLCGFVLMDAADAGLAKVAFACSLVLLAGALLYDPRRRHEEI